MLGMLAAHLISRFFAMPSRLLGRSLRLLVAVLLVSPSPQLAVAKKVGPPTRDSVAAAWIGLSEDELYLFRVVLALEGGGSVGYVFVDEEPNVFVISSWRYDSGRIAIEVEFPPGSESWKGPLAGSVSARAMKLRMSGKGWSRSILLRRESELEGRWLALKSKMDGTPQTKGPA